MGARVRRSRALVVTFDDGRVKALSFYTQRAAELDELALGLILALEPWTSPEALFELFDGRYPRADVAGALVALLDIGLLLVEGTPDAKLDERVAREWEWGACAGHFHFAVKNAAYAPPEAVREWMQARIASTPLVDLSISHGDAGIALPAPPGSEPVLATMRRRRSSRAFEPDMPLPIAALADCLFSGFGVVGFIEHESAGAGRLPLTMTPSGGARNPYEAYVAVRNVSTLAPGVYHYAAVDHTLARVDAPGSGLPGLHELLGGQEWFAHAGVVLLLAASFRRTSWKYPHPGALRVVLIEAGHIAQNVLLCATRHGLAAAPTCAISDGVAERICGLDPVTQAVVYAVALGVRSSRPSWADPVCVMR